LNFYARIAGKFYKLDSEMLKDTTYLVKVFGGEANKSYPIYAMSMDDSKTYGSANVYNMKYKEIKVKLVPVINKVQLDNSLTDFQNRLNKIFEPLGKKFIFNMDDKPFTDDDIKNPVDEHSKLDFLNVGLNTTEGNGIFANETKEMKLLRKLYQKNTSDDNSYDAYLFLIPKNTNYDIKGFMPRTYSVGYLFVGESGNSNAVQYNDIYTAAHELCHGVFGLQHTFDYLGVAQGVLGENLMDYSTADIFRYPSKYFQWYNIENPSDYHFPFVDTPEDGEVVQKCIVDAIVETIINVLGDACDKNETVTLSGTVDELMANLMDKCGGAVGEMLKIARDFKKIYDECQEENVDEIFFNECLGLKMSDYFIGVLIDETLGEFSKYRNVICQQIKCAEAITNSDIVTAARNAICVENIAKSIKDVLSIFTVNDVDEECNMKIRFELDEENSVLHIHADSPTKYDTGDGLTFLRIRSLPSDDEPENIVVNIKDVPQHEPQKKILGKKENYSIYYNFETVEGDKDKWDKLSDLFKDKELTEQNNKNKKPIGIKNDYIIGLPNDCKTITFISAETKCDKKFYMFSCGDSNPDDPKEEEHKKKTTPTVSFSCKDIPGLPKNSKLEKKKEGSYVITCSDLKGKSYTFEAIVENYKVTGIKGSMPENVSYIDCNGELVTYITPENILDIFTKVCHGWMSIKGNEKPYSEAYKKRRRQEGSFD
jgi:hypothetical protein